MRYEVEFTEKATVKRVIQCIVDVDSEEDVREAVESGDFEYVDGWDDDDLQSEILEITKCEPSEDD